MSATNEYRGSCLCGAVSLTIKADDQDVGACHCNMCQTWGGGPLLALESIKEVKIDGENEVTVFQSSDWAERGFCRQCGTHLFYRLQDGNHYAIPVGLVDSSGPWNFTTQIFIDEKPSFYDFANQTRNMTGHEVFEAFAGSADKDKGGNV
ncbi:aldehyde-activating protein [Litchfieldella qijiaojingensis]|uniref:Aldehyde-activating protein n=1 Tax=Litchfieldella qijiaojingensis TaxID=980347 RepID=A0ABQ2Z0C2_9GAMM|nr:GFA family protein [Halomonas qijiaojingensis]GGY01044.1 aldehyde-activating protein [Halomonas qijiaojingensis]